MDLTKPRIPPLSPAEWNAEVRELLQPLEREGQVDNLYTTLARHPKLLKRWKVFGAHVLGKSTLPTRDREILILRLGWLCQSRYEWVHHVLIGKAEGGLDERDIARIQEGPAAAGLQPFDAALLRAVDELHARCFIEDFTWKTLTERYDEQQMLDLLFTVGQYRLLAMLLKSAGIQLEERVTRPAMRAA